MFESDATNRRSRQHRRRRGRRPVGRGRHRIHRLQRSQLSRVPCTARRARRRDPTHGDELQRQRSPHRASSSAARTSTRSSPSAAILPTVAFSRLLADIVRFNRAARRLVAGEARWSGPDRLPRRRRVRRPTHEESLAEFVRRGRYLAIIRAAVPRPLRRVDLVGRSGDLHALPRPRRTPRFMHNHGLLELAGRPEWRTVTGGSRRYVEALTAPFSHRIQLGMPVHKIVTARRRPAARNSSRCSPSRGPELVRPCDRGDAQRPGVAHACRRDARRARDPRRDRVPAQHRHVAHRRTDAAAQPARAGKLELRDRRRRARNHGDLLDEPPAVDRDAAGPLLVTLNRPDEIDPRMRDRRVRVRTIPSSTSRDGGAAASRRDPGPAGHLLRGRLLGLRIPRGRRAERTRGRAAIEVAPMTASLAPARTRDRTRRADVPATPGRRDLRGNGATPPVRSHVA